MSFKPIETERLLLRSLKVEDAEPFYGYRSDPEIFRFQGRVPETVEDVRLFFQTQTPESFLVDEKWFQIGIEHKESNELVGDIGIRSFGGDFPQAELGISLTRNNQGQGFAQEALIALMDDLFGRGQIHRILGSIDPRNVASINLFERLSFRKEAHFVKSIWTRGEWVDDVIYAILREEWLSPGFKLEKKCV